MKIELMALAALLLLVLWLGRERIKNYFHTPTATVMSSLDVGKEYPLENLNILSDNDLSVMIDGKSYFVKLYLKVKEGGRDAMADVLQSCSSANLFVHSKSKDGILVDVYGKVASNALEDNNHFSIVSFLKEKNLIYEN